MTYESTFRFENPGLAQFDHRIGAYIVAGFVAYVYAKGIKLSGMAKRSAKLAAAITAFQVGFGIFMLMMQAPEGVTWAIWSTRAGVSPRRFATRFTKCW